MQSLRRSIVLDRVPVVPMSIAGCALWLKADSIGLAEGAGVDVWADSSGNGNVATQATAGLQPLLKKAIVNGRPVVRFDATDDKMATPLSFSSPTPFTVVSVYASDATGYTFGRMMQGGGASWLIGPYNNDATNRHTVYNGAFIRGAAWTANVFDVVTVTQQTGLTALYVNGVLGGTNSPANWPGALGLGAQGASTDRMAGDIAEILVWRHVLVPRDVLAVQRYLGRKYNIAVT